MSCTCLPTVADPRCEVHSLRWGILSLRRLRHLVRMAWIVTWTCSILALLLGAYTTSFIEAALSCTLAITDIILTQQYNDSQAVDSPVDKERS